MDAKISSDQDGVMEGAGEGEKIMKIFKELSDGQVREVKFCLETVHRGKYMFETIKPSRTDKSGLESFVH